MVCNDLVYTGCECSKFKSIVMFLVENAVVLSKADLSVHAHTDTQIILFIHPTKKKCFSVV